MPLIQLRHAGDILVLSLDNPPAHAFSPALLCDLAAALDEIEAHAPAGLVITAEGERFFSAGLDIVEAYELDRDAIKGFMEKFIGSLLRLFRFPGPVVAAVNGHAIAGGALLALTADRRILARGEGLFGLNEVQVGLPLPGPLFEMARAAIGTAPAAEVLLEGRNFGTDDALRIGLAHEVVEPGALLDHAVALAERLARPPRRALRRMKELLHAGAERAIAASARDDPFIDIWFEEETRRTMGAARDRLLARRRG